MQAGDVRQGLTQWLPPADFQALVEEARNRVGPYVIFRSPAWSFWRDAWAIARFAELADARRIQLTEENERYPDGRVDFAGEISDVEVTEAMMPGRKRANEYVPASPTIWHDPVEEWDKRLDALPDVLESVIQKKANKLYGSKPLLLVYLNIGAYDGFREAETRAAIVSIKERNASSFKALRVLWGSEVL